MPHAAQAHMNPFMVLGLVGLVILAVLMADTITRTSLAIQSWVYTKITRRKAAPKPASVEEVYELLKVIADRQGDILQHLWELRDSKDSVESILVGMTDRQTTAHSALAIHITEIIQANRAALLVLKDISDKLHDEK